MAYADCSIPVQDYAPSLFAPATEWPSSQAYPHVPGRLAPEKPSVRDGRQAIDVRTGGNRRPEQWSGLRARMALDTPTRTDAFRLRHLCYASKAYIDHRDNGLFSDEYDSEPANATMVVYDHDQPVGSVRVCTTATPASPNTRALPVAHVFPTEVQALLASATNAVEINRLVTHPDHAHNLGLVFVLMRLAGYVIGKYNPDFVTSCVRVNHVAFYKRLQFEQMAGPRMYTGLKFLTNFMVARQDRYDIVRRTVPVLNISPSAASTYDTLWEGSQVEVFDHETGQPGR